MDVLAKRLKDLRNKRKLNDAKWTQEYVADLIGVARPTYTAYENGTKEPPLGTLNRIADIFETNLDYLQGRTNDPSPLQAAPEWATAKDKRDFKKMLEEDAPVMFDGVPIEGDAKQRVLDVLTGLFWEAKEMNKKTYGRKNKSKENTKDNDTPE